MIHLLQKHRHRGAVLDTNVLLAWAIGTYDPSWLGLFKRVENFIPADAHLLQRLLMWTGEVIVTPNIMTEVANLAAQMGEPRREAFFRSWSSQISTYFEHYVPSSSVVTQPEFVRLFLTDMGIVELSRQGRLVLTDDLKLAAIIAANGDDVLNFNHVRQVDWKFR